MAMRRHLSPDAVIDLVEGRGTPDAHRHAEQCEACRVLVDEARAAWALTSGADVPEPSPLFWEHLSRRVAEATAAEPAAGAHGAGSQFCRRKYARRGGDIIFIAAVPVMGNTYCSPAKRRKAA